jgi:hypothetical protein
LEGLSVPELEGNNVENRRRVSQQKETEITGRVFSVFSVSSC